MISESNELLSDLKKLFAESDADKQVRLMTVALIEWGQQKIEKWCACLSYSFGFPLIAIVICRQKLFSSIRFQSKPNQARRSLILLENKGVLAYPQCLGGNIPLSDATLDAMISFNYEDGISRISSDSKDTIKINGKTVAIRFLKMFILDAYRIFIDRLSGAVARSTLNALRPKKVKVAKPHDTCMCIIHENMNLLLMVCIDSLLVQAYRSLATSLELLLSEKHQCNYFINRPRKISSPLRFVLRKTKNVSKDYIMTV